MSFRQENIEITLLEDPACNWCWAFQPVTTTFFFEFCHSLAEHHLDFRRVLGGLCDRPVIEPTTVQRHWRMITEVSGMPVNPDIWNQHLLQTTFEACRAIKAASLISPQAAHRLLRKLREAFFVESTPIDDRETILALAGKIDLNVEQLKDHLSSGRADFLFQRDRREASSNKFGFPTMVVSRPGSENKDVLHGMVSYDELMQSILRFGFPAHLRQPFKNTREDWIRLFQIHPRLTAAEVRRATGLSGPRLDEQVADHGIRLEGAFYSMPLANGQKAAS